MGITGIDNNIGLYGYGNENEGKTYAPYTENSNNIADTNDAEHIDGTGKENTDQTGKDDKSKECQTCKNRKYVDGSDEMNVSFKSAAHVSPEAASAAVRAHEGQHVSNAYNKASESDGKVISASVRIQTSVCPECGRSYVSGGVTSTQIKYYNESNPYQQDLKAADGIKARGERVDAGV